MISARNSLRTEIMPTPCPISDHAGDEGDAHDAGDEGDAHDAGDEGDAHDAGDEGDAHGAGDEGDNGNEDSSSGSSESDDSDDSTLPRRRAQRIRRKRVSIFFVRYRLSLTLIYTT